MHKSTQSAHAHQLVRCALYRWRRHAAAAEEELREQQALAEEKHASAAAAEAEAQEQSALASTKDAVTRVRAQAIARALAARIWTVEADKSAKQAVQCRRGAAVVAAEADSAQQVCSATSLRKLF